MSERNHLTMNDGRTGDGVTPRFRRRGSSWPG
jgi:hypothetical protein